MTQKEAFEFLELPESASRSQIKIRLVEKKEYYEDLSENAPSDFLRRIHSKNVGKLATIQHDFFPWAALESDSEVVLPLEPESDELIAEDELQHTIIIGRGPAPEKKKRSGPPAYLILHTENQEAKSFALQKGKNYLGRKVQPGLTPFIVVEDVYVSRVHAVIIVEEDGEKLDCLVDDSSESNSGNPSKNGTFLNGDKQRIKEKQALKDGDTVQVGLTKLVVKFNTRELKDIMTEISKSDFMNTVDIR